MLYIYSLLKVFEDTSSPKDSKMGLIGTDWTVSRSMLIFLSGVMLQLVKGEFLHYMHG